MGLSQKETEKRLKELEKELKKLYKDSYREIDIIINRYMADFKIRDENMREALKNGTYPKLYGVQAGLTPDEHYKQWRLAQIGRGKRWKAVQSEIAKKISETNKQAEKLINKKLSNIYAFNKNFTAFEIEKRTGIAFNIVNEKTIEELIMGNNHTEFRTVRVNPKRDYKWNSKRIQNALTSGLLQGYSIPQITESFIQIMGGNRSAAIRNARTAVTSAQAAGCMNTYKEAEDMGIEMEKEWLATNDDRTRDSHSELDGVRVSIDEEFPNGLMYPGDPNGDPSEVYNCRCTMVPHLINYPHQSRTDHDYDTYLMWLESKEGFN